MHDDNDLLDPLPETDGNAALDTMPAPGPEVDDDEQEGQNTADSEAEQETGEGEDSTSTDGDHADDGGMPEIEVPKPGPELLAKVSEHLRLQKKLRDVEDEKKRVAKQWSEREKGINGQIDAIVEEIDECKWHEVFDEKNGVVYRWNMLDPDETETRPYSPPPQQEIQFVDDRLRTVAVGLYGEDLDGNAYRVEAVAKDSVVLRYYDDGTKRVAAESWQEFAPREDVEQSEYEETFSEERAHWTEQVLDAVSEEGSTLEQIMDALLLSSEHEARVADALDRLEKIRGVRIGTREVDGEEEFVVMVRDPQDDDDEDPPPNGQPTDEQVSLLESVSEQWEPVSTIAERAGLDKKFVARALKDLIEAGQVEAEGERRGKKYRRVVSD